MTEDERTEYENKVKKALERLQELRDEGLSETDARTQLLIEAGVRQYKARAKRIQEMREDG